MSYRGLAGLMRAGTALGLLIVASTQVQAGAFALREQSAYGQGVSFAGMAAGGALSSMYWNPATMTQYGGLTFEGDVAAIFPKASHSYTTSTIAGTAFGAVGYRNSVDNSGLPAAVPSFYASWQFAPQFWLGLAVNAPFGLGVAFPNAWAGSNYGQNADLKTYNFNPQIAWKINDWISVGVGVQAQYMTVNYVATVPVPVAGLPTSVNNIGGAGWGYGFTAGVSLTPFVGTQIGIGYRSAINQDIDGAITSNLPVGGSTLGSVSVELPLPDLFSVGIRQRLTPQWTVMGQFEWQHWGRIGTPVAHTPSGGNATLAGSTVRFPFEYSDGWFLSFGAEYIWTPELTLRAGIGFEKSPITDSVRTPRLPDNDRMWYSAGLSYKPPGLLFRGVTVDLGYSYIDVKDTPINISAASGNPWFSAGLGSYIGSVDSHIHILSFGLRYQWDAELVSKKVLITK